MKKLSLYYIAEAYGSDQYTASILRKDNEKILQSCGFTALHFRHTRDGSVLVKISRLINAVQLAFSIKTNSLVVFHFPLLATAYKWLLLILKWRGIKTTALIIDIDGIRDKDQKILKEELYLLQQFTTIIAHNPAMKKTLLQYLPSATIVTIDLFDYAVTGSSKQRGLSNNICFAGNLAKSQFVYSLGKISGSRLLIYGLGYEASLNTTNNFVYKGTVEPALLPSVLEGSFGLVWDGDSIDHCDPYLRLNNPHKLSLYIASRLPVIAWKDSAAGAFVEQYKIGLTVNSLTEIPARISVITPEAYQDMCRQVSIIAQQMNEGFFLKKAIGTIIALQG